MLRTENKHTHACTHDSQIELRIVNEAQVKPGSGNSNCKITLYIQYWLKQLCIKCFPPVHLGNELIST